MMAVFTVGPKLWTVMAWRLAGAAALGSGAEAGASAAGLVGAAALGALAPAGAQLAISTARTSQTSSRARIHGPQRYAPCRSRGARPPAAPAVDPSQQPGRRPVNASRTCLRAAPARPGTYWRR